MSKILYDILLGLRGRIDSCIEDSESITEFLLVLATLL